MKDEVEPDVTEQIEKVTAPVKVRPQTPIIREADYKKKEDQKVKFEKIKSKIESKKEEAAAKFKNGSYAEAIKLYKNSAEQLDNALEDFPLFKKEIS